MENVSLHGGTGFRPRWPLYPDTAVEGLALQPFQVDRISGRLLNEFTLVPNGFVLEQWPSSLTLPRSVSRCEPKRAHTSVRTSARFSRSSRSYSSVVVSERYEDGVVTAEDGDYIVEFPVLWI